MLFRSHLHGLLEHFPGALEARRDDEAEIEVGEEHWTRLAVDIFSLFERGFFAGGAMSAGAGVASFRREGEGSEHSLLVWSGALILKAM